MEIGVAVACILLGLVQVFMGLVTNTDSWQSGLMFKFLPFVTGMLMCYLALKGLGFLP